MSSETSRIDVRYLIAEVAKRHGIMLRPDDAAFAVVTISELVLERTVQQAIKTMAATLDRFDTSIQRAENRAGEILGQQVRESVQEVRRVLHEDIGAASIRADEVVRRLQRAHTERMWRFWTGIALLCATLLCAGSFWLGRLMVAR